MTGPCQFTNAHDRAPSCAPRRTTSTPIRSSRRASSRSPTRPASAHAVRRLAYDADGSPKPDFLLNPPEAPGRADPRWPATTSAAARRASTRRGRSSASASARSSARRSPTSSRSNALKNGLLPDRRSAEAVHAELIERRAQRRHEPSSRVDLERADVDARRRHARSRFPIDPFAKALSPRRHSTSSATCCRSQREIARLRTPSARDLARRAADMIQIYDTTLRDGTQREGISLSCRRQAAHRRAPRRARASPSSRAAGRAPTRRTPSSSSAPATYAWRTRDDRGVRLHRRGTGSPRGRRQPRGAARRRDTGLHRSSARRGRLHVHRGAAHDARREPAR